MKSKVVLVTGGGSGLGRALSRMFAERGSKVVIADVEDTGGAETVASIVNAGGEATYVHADVSIEADAEAMVAAAVSAYGRLDTAVNNAGVDVPSAPLADHSLAALQQALSVNLVGVFLGLKYEIRQMLSQGGGTIVNVSSIAGVRGHPGIAPYSAAKHGVNGLTKTAALDYGASGIRVNSLCPGGIRTPMLDHYLDANPEMRRLVVDGNPMRRMGEATEMAEAAYWLCSDAASYVNGHELIVDGGKTASDA